MFEFEQFTASLFPFYKYKVCLFQRQRALIREREVRHPNACIGWDWAGLKLAAGNSVAVPLWVAGAPPHEPPRVCISSELESGARVRNNPGTHVWDVGVFTTRLNAHVNTEFEGLVLCAWFEVFKLFWLFMAV